MNPIHFNTDEARWNAVRASNARADGLFYYAVITTGIFCLPSCTSKLPNRANVEYFTSGDEAEAAGYRACKRCRPTAIPKAQEIEQKMIEACRVIEQNAAPIKLDDLAARVNLSAYHFHRQFKKTIGVTPRQYAAKIQSQRFHTCLESSPSVTDAIYSAGYGSSGSVYDKRQDRLAMKPGDYRKGAEGIMITYGTAQCYLGWVIVAATGRGVCAIAFGDDSETLPDQIQARFPHAQLHEGDRGFKTLIREVVDFIGDPKSTVQIPLDIQGTSFQQQVWNVLRNIKPGETLSYTDVAERLGKPKAVRAVASACAANNIAVLIPCHRVISKSGKTGGYRWGTDRKLKLLEMEQDQLQRVSGTKIIRKNQENDALP